MRGNPNTDWFRDAKYGVFVHYLEDLQNEQSKYELNRGKHTDWSSAVHEFDVHTFADQIEQTGAGYVIFAILQNSGYIAVPNAKYDFYTGQKKTADRDLVEDLYAALHPKGIRLMLYVGANAPMYDTTAQRGLSFVYNEPSPDGYAAFRVKWFEIMKEWSDRYGAKVAGWWVDGLGDETSTTSSWDDTTVGQFADALKSGNPDAIVAFNRQNEHPHGLQVHEGVVGSWTTGDDYTAGEAFVLPAIPASGWIDGYQWHTLTYLGNDWAYKFTRFEDAELENYVKNLTAVGAVITLDAAVYRDGSLCQEQLNQLKSLKRVIRDQHAVTKPEISPVSVDKSAIGYQADLGQSVQIDKIKLNIGNETDHPDSRRNFEVWGSESADFAAYDVIAAQGSTPFEYKMTWTAFVSGIKKYRYIRIVKRADDELFIAGLKIYPI